MKAKLFKLVSPIIVLALALAGFSAARAQNQASAENPREVIYMSSTMQLNDGISLLFAVNLDQVAERANLTLLPNGEVPYDHVDALAVSPDGSRIYMISDGRTTYPNATLAYYDVASAQVATVGVITFNGENLYEIDQSSFSPQGVLYITQNTSDALYMVDPETAVATEVGQVVDQASGQVVDIFGADIAFTADGSMFMVTNSVTTNIYALTLPDGPGVVSANLLGPTGDQHQVRGLAVRANGFGDLIEATDIRIDVVNKVTGGDILRTLTYYWNDEPFVLTAGDLSNGRMTLCNSPKLWWETNPWNGEQVTVVGVPVDETLGKDIMVHAHWANFSKMIAQLVTAKLNVNNATGLPVIDEAEAWLAAQGIVQADGTLDWDKPFASREQQDAAFMYFVHLRQFNLSSPCQ